ncbi:hypothetical protein L798_00967 [Zootermopsis nevadensis]|uniref:Uncharacterized protein n=1 Tax=Zootermopsis nevadensis TaxID=136037 RepID=A0A067QLB9_ZOONE|nr:hypothetical protein L798_00967 [Zootermopsis nevadensis]
MQFTVTKVTIMTASNHIPFFYTYVGVVQTPKGEAGWKENTLMKTPRQKQFHVSRPLLLQYSVCEDVDRCDDDNGAYGVTTGEEWEGSSFGVLHSEEEYHNLRRADFKEIALVLPNTS